MNKGELSITIDLDEMEVDGRWAKSIGDLIKDQVKKAVVKRVEDWVRTDVTLNYAIKRLSDDAITEMIETHLRKSS